MPTTQTQLFPPPVRGSVLEKSIQLYLASLQYQLPLRIGDTTSGPLAEALPPAGLNSTTGQSNQNQEIVYIKGSADANTWTITGAINGSAVLSAQYDIARFKSDGTNWWLSAAGPTGGGAVTSVFGRTGAVVAMTGDYNVSQVTGAVPDTRTVATTAPLTGGGNLSANRTIAISNFTGDAGAGGAAGAVPAPAAGDAALHKFLKATGGWVQAAASDLSDGTTGTGAVVEAIDPTFTDYIQFAGTAAPATPPAGNTRIYALTSSGVTRLVQKGDSGFELVFFRDAVQRVQNVSGGTITIGTAVNINGTTGTTPSVTTSKADAQGTADVFGLLLTASAANNAFCTVMRQGLLGGVGSGLNTSAWAAGDKLYLSASVAGALTNVPPAAPNFQIQVGEVIVSHATNGQIILDIAPFHANVAPAQLPTPTTTTFGGVKDLAAVATKFLTSIVNGVPVAAQPAASDITGLATIATTGKWSDLQNATAALTLANGANATTFNQTSAVTWTWANTTAATNVLSQSSPIWLLSGTYWNGAASATDGWTIQTIIGNGTNGTSTLAFAHSGSSGIASVSIPPGTLGTSAAYGLTFTGTTVGLNATASILSVLTDSTSTYPTLRFYAGGNSIGQLGLSTSSSVERVTLTANRNPVTIFIAGDNRSSTTNPSVTIGSEGTNAGGYNPTSGTMVGVSCGKGTGAGSAALRFVPSSGNADFVGFQVFPEINQTSTSSGNYTAFKVNVVETALKGTDNRLLDLQAGVSGGTSQFTITNSGIVKTYKGIATVADGLPYEVGTADLTGQSAAKTATTLCTPTATGWYRISAYLKVTTTATTSSVLAGTAGVTITFTDGTDSVAQSVVMQLGTETGAAAINNAGNTTTTVLHGSLAAYAKTGVAIQYAIDYTSVGVTAMQYAARLRCEAMG